MNRTLIALASLVLVSCASTRKAPEPEPREFQIVALEHAYAYDLSKALSALTAETSMRVQVDNRTNSLLLSGTPQQLTAAQDLISKLDIEIESSTAKQIELIALEHARASDVEDVLQDILGRRTSGISIDPRTNSLLVEANPSELARIKTLIVHLDRPQ